MISGFSREEAVVELLRRSREKPET